jgi:Domain of unknown function (DUF1707)
VIIGPEVWREFDHDPRSPELAPMRASDADRDIVLRTLGEAYAEGRIDRDEYDERADAVHSAKTLGELPAVLEDLVPSTALSPYAGLGLDARSVDERAVSKWERSRREAFMGFLIPTVICWVVWALTMFGGFPWPVFPMIGTAIPVVTMSVQRKDIIESNKTRIVRKQERELRRRQRRQLPPPG